MLKKIIIILFVLLIMFFITVKVEAYEVNQLPIQYVQIGLGDDALLEENNLTLKSGFVNWNVEGSYVVTYNDRQNNIYKKTYIVLPDKANQTYLKVDEEKIINYKNFNEVVDVFYISESSYYVVSNYQIPDSTLHDQEKVCITFYENNIYKWEYRYYKYSRYESAFLYNDNLIVSCKVYNESDNYINTIALFEITKDRQIIKSREIKANKSCFIYGMHLFEDNLFLITSTSGNDFDYKNIKEDYVHRLVILKLSYTNFQIIDGISEQKLDEFTIIDTSFYNTRITINVLLKQNEIINGVVMTNCILEYNDNLDFINDYYYSTQTKDYLGYQVTMKDICFYSIDNRVNTDCVKVEYVNKGVYFKNILFDLENECNINNVEVVNVNGDDIYFCLKNGITKNCKFLGFAKINSENGITYFTTTTDDINILSSKINNGYIVNTYIKNNNLLYKSYNLIEIQTIINETSISFECKKQVVVNGIKANRSNYIDSVNTNVYGNYQNFQYIKDHFNNCYLLGDNIIVYFNANVKSNGVYQKGLKLQFNGNGFLNGIAIKNNFIVNDVGKYLLEIQGENTENILISFEISELTVLSSPKEKMNLKLDYINFNQEPLIDETYINTTCDFTTAKKYDDIVPLVISIISFGILSLILLRKKI